MMNSTCRLLENKVTSIMTRSVVKVDMQDSMQQVNFVLHEKGLTTLPVVDPSRQDCFGIVTLKDISSLNARKVNLQTVYAWEACTYKPITVTPDTSIEEALELMVQNRIHYAVVEESRGLEGYLSTFDIIAACMASRKNCISNGSISCQNA